MVEWGRRLIAIEVKATEEPKFQHAESLRLFMQEYPETSAGIVVHTGDRVEQLDESIYAIPFHRLV